MTVVTAAMCLQLRHLTDIPLMECKHILLANNGNIEQATSAIKAYRLNAEDVPSLREVANQKLRDAEQAWHTFACSLDVGAERSKAFEVYENVRNAGRVS